MHLLLGGKHFILDSGPLIEKEDPMVAGLERISHFFGEYPEVLRSVSKIIFLKTRKPGTRSWAF